MTDRTIRPPSNAFVVKTRGYAPYLSAVDVHGQERIIATFADTNSAELFKEALAQIKAVEYLKGYNAR